MKEVFTIPGTNISFDVDLSTGVSYSLVDFGFETGLAPQLNTDFTYKDDLIVSFTTAWGETQEGNVGNEFIFTGPAEDYTGDLWIEADFHQPGQFSIDPGLNLSGKFDFSALDFGATVLGRDLSFEGLPLIESDWNNLFEFTPSLGIGLDFDLSLVGVSDDQSYLVTFA